MRGLNKAQIIGRLGQEVTIINSKNGVAIANLPIATKEQWIDNNGEKREETEWHRVTLFGKLAEIAGQYLKKGSSVYIEGKLKTQKYTDRNGIERWTTTIHADRLEMLDSAPKNQQSYNQMPVVANGNFIPTASPIDMNVGF